MQLRDNATFYWMTEDKSASAANQSSNNTPEGGGEAKNEDDEDGITPRTLTPSMDADGVLEMEGKGVGKKGGQSSQAVGDTLAHMALDIDQASDDQAADSGAAAAGPGPSLLPQRLLSTLSVVANKGNLFFSNRGQDEKDQEGEEEGEEGGEASSGKGENDPRVRAQEYERAAAKRRADRRGGFGGERVCCKLVWTSIRGLATTGRMVEIRAVGG